MAEHQENPILAALEQARTETTEARQRTEDLEGLAAALLKQAAFAAVAGELPESRGCLEEARRTYQQLGRFDSVARCLLLLARLSRAEQDQEGAAEQLDLSMWLFEQSGDLLGQADVLIEDGEMALAQQRVDRAEEQFLKARELFRTARESSREIDALKAAALARQLAADYQQAIRFFEEALDLAEQSANQEQVLETTLALGGLHAIAGERRDARGLLRQARELAAAQEDPEKEVMALVHLASLQAAQGELGKALRLSEQARKIAVQSVDVAGYLLAVTLLSQVLRAQGDDQGCLDALFRASNGLADLLGETGRQPIQQMLEALRTEWGEERYHRSLESFIEARRKGTDA